MTGQADVSCAAMGCQSAPLMMRQQNEQIQHDEPQMLAGNGGAALALAGCSNGVGNNAAARLDARVDQTHQFLLQNYPNAAP